MTAFGDRLKYLRKLRDYKQSDLGELLGLSPSAIGLYERSAREPSLEVIGKIAREFDVSTDYLLGLTDDPKPETKRHPNDLREFLEDNEVMFNGLKLSERDKERAVDLLTGLYHNSRR